MKPINLRVEYLTNPIGIDIKTPIGRIACV